MASYSTRNDVFSKPMTVSVDGAQLRIETEGAPPRSVPLATIATLRLSFAPTRAESRRYRCEFATDTGERWAFFNRSYRGVYDFEDTSASYVDFVRELHAALRLHSRQCRFESGVGGVRYLFNVVAVGFLALVLIGATVFFVFVGVLWVLLIKILLLVLVLPTAWNWFRRNQPRHIEGPSVPSNVLPLPTTTPAPPASP